MDCYLVLKYSRQNSIFRVPSGNLSNVGQTITANFIGQNRFEKRRVYFFIGKSNSSSFFLLGAAVGHAGPAYT